jgi:exodeoxyribonuclease VII small subunit
MLDDKRLLCLASRVANASKNAAQNPPPKNNLQFEEALKKLEDIVEAMESEELPLEELLLKFEEGTRLTKVCQEKLAEAELKIKLLEKSAGGEMKLKTLSSDLSEE